MNQGHAQQRINDPAQISAAIHSYEQAIAIYRSLPSTADSLTANSLAAAWMNRGQLLHRLHGTVQAAAALDSFDQAAALLRPLQAADNPWPQRNFAGTLLNRACLLIDLAEHRAALDSAREALPLATTGERLELVDADLALKLRRVACDAIGQLIALVPREEQTALASEASDFVDEGLALARHWETQNEFALHPVSIRLFRFGAQLYRIHQPHFLAEFLLEQLKHAPLTRDVVVIACENVEAALAARPDTPFLTVGDPASERHLQTARDLTALHQRLSALLIPTPATVTP